MLKTKEYSEDFRQLIIQTSFIDQVIINKIRQNLDISATAIQNELLNDLGVSISERTIQYHLNEGGCRIFIHLFNKISEVLGYVDQWRREEVKAEGGYFENERKCEIFRKSEKILDEFSPEFRGF